jgi:hypothetical protein
MGGDERRVLRAGVHRGAEPQLLAVNLLPIENRRPRAMFLCVLLGGMGTALTIGLVDVLTIHADTINAQETVSAGVDLALGWRKQPVRCRRAEPAAHQVSWAGCGRIGTVVRLRLPRRARPGPAGASAAPPCTAPPGLPPG